MSTDTIVKEVEKIIPKKVTITASRRHGWLPEDHDGSYRFSHTSEHLTLQRDRHTGMLNTGLTEADEKRLEGKLGLKPGELSRHNSEYWSKFKVVIPKEGIVLHPATVATDEIAWRVMQVHQDVANSIAEKYKTGFERYMMHSEEEEAENINKEINIKLEAYKKLGEMSESQLVNFLKVYGKSVGKDSSLEFIKAQVGKIVDTQPQLFIDTVSNPNYKAHVFLKTCVEKNVLKEIGGKYMRPGGEVIGYSLEQTLDFLQNKDNTEVISSLKGQVEATK